MQTGSQQIYDCIGFHKQLPKGKASGSILIDSNHIEFGIADQRVSAPLQGLHISLGGASNRLVYFEHPQLPDWHFYTSDRRVLQNTHLHNLPGLVPLLNNACRKRWFGWGLFALVSSLLLALPLLVVLRMDFLTNLVAQQIPVEWEQQLGESALAQYQFGKEFLAQQESDKLLKPLVDPLLNALDNSRYQYRFQIVSDASLNAFALPAGQIVIHSELILRADSAEELLGVLAHEIQHVEQQHGLRNMLGASSIYLLASALFGDATGVLAVLSSAAPLLINQRYSRTFETEADVKAFSLLQKANINPAGLASFFEKMIAEEKRQMDKLMSEENQELAKQALKFLSTHPASEARIQRLQKLAQTHHTQQAYLDLQPAFVALQTAVVSFVTNQQGDLPNEN